MRRWRCNSAAPTFAAVSIRGRTAAPGVVMTGVHVLVSWLAPRLSTEGASPTTRVIHGSHGWRQQISGLLSEATFGYCWAFQGLLRRFPSRNCKISDSDDPQTQVFWPILPVLLHTNKPVHNCEACTGTHFDAVPCCCYIPGKRL